MPMDLDYLEGKRFCVVYVQAEGDGATTLNMKCVHGRANVEKGKLTVENDRVSLPVPSSCYPMIQPNDGTAMLRDAEYFVVCRVEGMKL